MQSRDLVQNFRGAQQLVEAIDRAVQAGGEKQITARIKQSLCELIREGRLSMPDSVCQPVEGHYARRLLYCSEAHGYSMVAMTWGPGQGTPLHDHAGLWCVEAVCAGTIRVEQYDVAERDGERVRFSREDNVRASVGTAGCLIPPHEYHTICNASEDDCAVTLHIYAREMECCNVFEPQGDGWYRKVRKSLVYDAA
ncbi:MAG TPA: cysteine dioxygenase family protein [Gammaproteobacteria bacterium]